ncbi:MAG: BrnA antitoxin family protein [Ottowia sp.]
MSKKPNPELTDEVNPEWTDEMFDQAASLQALLGSLQVKLRAGRGPNKAPVKERITIRLSPEVLAHFRDGGRGWQGRIDQALKEWVAAQV